MASIIGGRRGSWEIRESHATAAGPRSRTLATFRVLTQDVEERARSRAAIPIGDGELRRLALRAGAPVSAAAPDRAAAELLAELSAGRRPRAALERLLAEALDRGPKLLSDAQRSAAGWVGSPPADRAQALRDLLLLVDRLPAPRERPQLRFPRLESGPA